MLLRKCFVILALLVFTGPWLSASVVAAEAELPSSARGVDNGESETQTGIGRVVSAEGDVRVVNRSEQVLRLPVNASVFEGDQLITGADARLHLRLQDGAEIFLKPDSEIKLSRFRLDGEDNERSSVVDLLRGGFRTISGLIGRSDADDYRTETGFVTVGIRGTEYVVKLCPEADCTRSASRSDNEARLHAVVLAGAVSLTADEVLLLDAGDYASASVDELREEAGRDLPEGLLDPGSADAFAILASEQDDSLQSSKSWFWSLGFLLLLIGL